ncbi:MAG: HlyD family efflux transporter periplasmic adaptor subunit [Bacteroidales bacterium]|nr:HlyD family efflux transporter periplasmic adaptor subunit [Bacteroidales bacterium]
MKRHLSGVIAVLMAAAFAQSCGNDIEFDACGQIDAVQVTLSAENSGKIISLKVEEGDKVAAGQVLGAIDSLQSFLQIDELRHRIESAEARMVDIKRQGEPNQAQLASLKNDLNRYSSLLQSNAATQKQVDDIKDKITMLEAQIAAQNQSWERSNAGVRAEITTYETQMAQRQDQLSKCRIVVPVSGTILAKYAEEGESVTTGKPLLKIADMDNVFVRAYLTTAQLANYKLGDTVTVIPDDGSDSPKQYEGRLVWISDQAEFTPKNIQTRDERADMTYAVKVTVPNDGYLRLGMYAYIRK